MALTVGGLGSGLDTTSIIQQLMAAESAPQTALRAALGANTVKTGAWTSLASIVKGVQDKANALTLPSALAAASATTTLPDLVRATTGSTAAPGSLTFRVAQLAGAHQLASSGFASASTVVGRTSTVVTSGHDVVGATSVTAGAAATTGRHTVVISDRAAGASASGTVPATAPDPGTLLEVQVDGGATLYLDVAGAEPGAQGLRDHLQAQLTATGAAARVEVSGAGIVLTTTSTGPSASLTVGGAGATVLGMTPGTTTGTAQTVQVDGQRAALTTEADGSSALTLAGGTTVRFTGVPRAGTLSIGVAVTSSDTSTAADLASALASAGGPARAALVDTGDTAAPYKLVLSATGTGTAGALRVTSTSAALSGATELRAATDAEIVLGTGDQALTLTRSSNSVTDLLPGVTLDLVKADPTADVTVAVARDDKAVTAKVKALVDGLNETLSWVKTNSTYDIAGKKGGPMVGDNSVRALAGALTTAMSTPVAGTLRSAGQVGVTMTRQGTYELDEAKLGEMLASDPEGVAALVTGLATSVAEVAKAAAAKDGVLDVGKASTAARAKELQGRIEAWDDKLSAIQTRYQRQFSALDVALSRMNSQSSWLASQINSLPTG